ncbi:MAG: hypothetical protein HOP28_15175 [Gemmatimonadales bacterium]|nr:hypothetical protein [Gemmatimonadales bacterium]
MPIVQTLLAGAIDFAGLFPPASLELPAALDAFVDYRRGPDAWALGRFVVPADRLSELEALLRHRSGNPVGVPVSALLGAEAAGGLEAIERFNAGSASHGGRVESVEVKAASAADAPRVLAGLPPVLARYLEIPFGPSGMEALAPIADQGAFAKIRTGGVTAAAFSPPEPIADFLIGAALLRLPFKATAGLHHPLRGNFRLTYEAAAPVGTMYGYLNLLLASLVAWSGGTGAEVAAALLEGSEGALSAAGGFLAWRGRRFDEPAVAVCRTQFFHGFGSCSFREPLDELFLGSEA